MSRRGPSTASRRAIALGVLVLTFAVAAACDEQEPVTVPEERTFLDADGVIMSGEHVITNQQGIRTAYLQFDTMFQWTDSTHSALRGVDLVVFNEDGSERGRVVSDRGTFDPRGESLTAQENVVLTVPGQQRRLETSELHYDPEAEQLWSDSSFVMTEAGREVRGSSFTTDLQFRNFEVRGIGENDD